MRNASSKGDLAAATRGRQTIPSTFTPAKMRTAQTGSKLSFDRVADHQDVLTAELACGAILPQFIPNLL